jgi:hypothetical protein
MAVEIEGNKNEIQRMLCTTSETYFPQEFSQTESAEDFLSWLGKDPREYLYIELDSKLAEWRAGLLNTKGLITKYEKSIAILEGIQHFKTMIKHTNNSINGFGGSFRDLREKYMDKIDTYNRCIERLYNRYNNLL